MLKNIVEDTDNLSFYHKVLLPGLLVVLVGLAGTQIALLQSVARLEEKVNALTVLSGSMYTHAQAQSDWRYQAMVDAEQMKKIDSLEIQVKSHATQIHNIRKEQ
jgi:hypothetical protein